MERKITIIMEPFDAHREVGAVLRERLHLSKAQISSLKFRPHGICRNGQKVRVTERLEAGDRLELSIEETRADRVSAHLTAVRYPIDILYEDEDVICVWKPSGMVVHPAGGHYEDSMANYLRYYFETQGQQVQMRSIGRLDKDTAGILVFAKNRMAAAKLWQQREQGIFQKEYLALCEGVFRPDEFKEEHQIALPLLQKERTAPGQPHKMCVSPEGKPAVTCYQAVREAGEYTWVRLHLKTGRMHQIRVHMAALGHPLAGDSLYGNGKPDQTHAQLYAFRSEFVQPFTGRRICLQKEIQI